MNRYKTLWCPIGVQHDWQNCVYAHNYVDIRRNPAIGYGPRQCPHWDKSNSKSAYADRCPNGVRCPYAHGAKEQLYHPAHFKTVVCWDMTSAQGCPRSHVCAFHHNKDECRVEETKDLEFDYTRPLEGKQLNLLQKDFNTPPPIGAETDAPKPAMQQKKAAPAPVCPPCPPVCPPAAPLAAPPQVPVMVMMMPPALHHLNQGVPAQMPMMLPMHPQMLAAAGMQQRPGAPGQPAAPPVMMVPMPMAPMAAQGGVQPVNAHAEMVGQSPMSMNQYQNQHAGRFGMPDYGTPQNFSPGPAQSPTQSFQDLCSPTYQSSEAYEQYVRDIMNADGDEYQFDFPVQKGYPSGGATSFPQKRVLDSEGSTDEGTWSYASDRSSSLVMSP
jgi:hypothetical protein